MFKPIREQSSKFPIASIHHKQYNINSMEQSSQLPKKSRFVFKKDRSWKEIGQMVLYFVVFVSLSFCYFVILVSIAYHTIQSIQRINEGDSRFKTPKPNLKEIFKALQHSVSAHKNTVSYIGFPTTTRTTETNTDDEYDENEFD